LKKITKEITKAPAEVIDESVAPSVASIHSQKHAPVKEEE